MWAYMYAIYYSYKLINAVQKFSRFEYCFYVQPHRDIYFHSSSICASGFTSNLEFYLCA